jgi:hypothetical protein
MLWDGKDETMIVMSKTWSATLSVNHAKQLRIIKLEGEAQIAEPGDWVVRAPNGLQRYSAAKFEETFEVAPDSPPARAGSPAGAAEPTQIPEDAR